MEKGQQMGIAGLILHSTSVDLMGKLLPPSCNDCDSVNISNKLSGLLITWSIPFVSYEQWYHLNNLPVPQLHGNSQRRMKAQASTLFLNFFNFFELPDMQVTWVR